MDLKDLLGDLDNIDDTWFENQRNERQAEPEEKFTLREAVTRIMGLPVGRTETGRLVEEQLRELLSRTGEDVQVAYEYGALSAFTVAYIRSISFEDADVLNPLHQQMREKYDLH